MFHFIMAISLKNVEGTHDITLYINFRVLDETVDASLCSKMNNTVWIVFSENPVNFLFIFQVVFVGGEIVMFSKNFKAVVFAVDVVIVVDVVKPDDFMARSKQFGALYL